MAKQADLSDEILDAALELAETRHWEALRLYNIADVILFYKQPCIIRPLR